MMKLDQLIAEANQLSTHEKWQLLKHLLNQLDKTQDWHEFLEKTAGSLSDDPIERPEQPPFEENKPLE